MPKKKNKKPKYGSGLMDTGIPKQTSKKALIAKIMGIELDPVEPVEEKGYLTEVIEKQDAIVASGGWCAPKQAFYLEFYTSKPLFDVETLKKTDMALTEWSKKAAEAANKMAEQAAKHAKAMEGGITVLIADGSVEAHPKGELGYLQNGYPVPPGWKVAEDQSEYAKPAPPYFGSSSHVDGADTMAILNSAIPGFDEMTVTNPITGDETSLMSAIISLNDGFDWTREQIADWLETLDHDLTIRMNDEKREEATR